MSIITKQGLPVNNILKEEKVRILEDLVDENSSNLIQIAILNLMPLKEDTELQLLRKLSKSEQNIKVTFFNVISYIGKNTNLEHIKKFYSTFEEIKDKKFDGLIITGAPVEQMKFEDVLYWKELTKIMDWSKTNVKSTLYICWGAQAGLYYHYDIDKILLDKKTFGIFEHNVLDENSYLLKNIKPGFKAPHSRLDKEYKRDLSKGLKIEMPKNYYYNNTPDNDPIFSWEENGNTLYSNWVNYYLA